MPPAFNIRQLDLSQSYLYSLRYWPLWALLAMAFLVSRLPVTLQQSVGKFVGEALYWLGPRRRHIAAVNIELCMPELSAQEQHQLLKRSMRWYGVSIIESFMAWWSPASTLRNRVEYDGLEHLQQALQKKQGVLLLSGHFTTLEIGLRLLGDKIPFHIMYRTHKNRLFETVMRNGRERWIGPTIDRRDVRALLSSLKQGHALWYGPDQDYGRKHSVFVPFMGQQAATITGTSRFAKLSGAAVVPYFVERLPNARYKVTVQPALQDFPTDSLEQDAIKVNQLIESQIRRSPENYLWTHRRFKTRPEGEQRPY